MNKKIIKAVLAIGLCLPALRMVAGGSERLDAFSAWSPRIQDMPGDVVKITTDNFIFYPKKIQCFVHCYGNELVHGIELVLRYEEKTLGGLGSREITKRFRIGNIALDQKHILLLEFPDQTLELPIHHPKARL